MITVICALWYLIKTLRWELSISEGWVKDLGTTLSYRWSLRRFQWSGQRDFISAAEHKEHELPVCLPRAESRATPYLFFKHTCKPICIHVHASIRAQVSAHLHGSGAALTCAPPLKVALCLSSRAVAFAAWLVLRSSTLRFRKKHRTSSCDQHVLTRRLMCACLQASTSLVQLACHSLAPTPVLCNTNQRKEEKKTILLLSEL